MLSSLQEYGVRCLLQLARRPGGGPLTAREIAQAEGLSIDYVEKILSHAREHALVTSVRGVHGGFLLAKPAEQITLKDTFYALGGPLYTEQFCERYTGHLDACVHTGNCGIRPLWSFLTTELDRIMAQTSLRDLLQHEEAVAVQLAKRWELLSDPTRLPAAPRAAQAGSHR